MNGGCGGHRRSYRGTGRCRQDIRWYPWSTASQLGKWGQVVCPQLKVWGQDEALDGEVLSKNEM